MLLIVTVEEYKIGQLDRDNCCENISLQLNNILTELRTLKQEVHWTKANVASEVKKLKTGQSSSFLT